MTDERAPDPQPTETPPAGGPPEGGTFPDAGPPAAAPADAGSEPPPPLAPLVPGASAQAPSMDDTTAQPTSTWQAPAVAPPVAPPIAPPAPQPAVSWAPAPAAAASNPGDVTVWAKIAGVVLVIGGILGGLAGIGLAVFGSAVVQMVEDAGAMPDFEGNLDPAAVITGTIVFFGIVIILYSLVYLFGGIGVLRSRNWGRVLGLIVGIISGLLWLGGLSAPDRPGVRDSTIFSLIFFGIHAYIVVALIFLWRRRSAI